MRLAVFGAAGRMGQAVVRLARAQQLEVVGAVEAPAAAGLGQDVGEWAGVGTVGVAISADVGAALLGAEVAIDFTDAAVLPKLLSAARHAGVAFVSGTTGLDESTQELLDRAAQRIPVLWAPNMSIGVLVLTRLCRAACEALGPEYAVEIVETHHAGKRDAPSGTAGQLLAAVRSVWPDRRPQHGRAGQVGQRPPEEIGVHALRGGAVIGDHTVHLLGPLDRLELSHRAGSRDLFAAGALRAAHFVANRPAGRYELADVIGLGG